MALVLLGACSTATPPPSTPAPAPVPAPVARLAEPEIGSIATLLRLEDERRFDADALSRLIDEGSPELRRRAALGLGRIGDLRAAPLLLRGLADPVAEVRREAAFALGLLGDTSAAVIAALAERTLVDEASVAAEAVAALGKMPTETAYQAVTALLVRARDPAAAVPEAVLEEALLAVWRLPRPERALEAIAPFVWPAEVGIRWRATYAVMRMGTPASVGLLLPSIGDADPLVRSLAARGLRRPLADSAGAVDAVRAALLEAVGDPDPHVRINAVAALGGFGEPSLVEPVAALLADSEENVRIAALQALAQLPFDGSPLPVLDLAADPVAATGVRAAALTALVRIDPELGARAAAGWASAPRWLLRLHAVRAVAGLDWDLAAPALEILARDTHPLVATAALSAASRSRDTSRAAYALLLEGMMRTEVAIRAAATRGLARRAGPEDLAPLLEAYERAQADTGNSAALAAVDGLGVLRTAGTPVGNVFFARFPVSADAEVRRRVVERLGGDWPVPDEPADEPRPDSFYMDAVRRLVVPAHGGEPGPRLVIRVRAGDIVVELAPGDAPLTVLNMIDLVESGYYAADTDPDRRRWHRVVPNFVLQDGDPRGDGGGGPGYAIRDEVNRLRYERGVLGMALSGPDTGGSQFFITHSPQPHLDGGYTIFGRVIAGMDIADRVVQDEPILEMRIVWP